MESRNEENKLKRMPHGKPQRRAQAEAYATWKAGNEEHRLKRMLQKGAAKGAGIKASAAREKKGPLWKAGLTRARRGGLRQPPLLSGIRSEAAAEGVLESVRTVSLVDLAGCAKKWCPVVALLARDIAQIRTCLDDLGVGAFDGAVETFDDRHGFLLAECFAQSVAKRLDLRVVFE